MTILPISSGPKNFDSLGGNFDSVGRFFDSVGQNFDSVGLPDLVKPRLVRVYEDQGTSNTIIP